ncbi:unnamed protein product [Effrenium voratum]|nr:unnamed protein product [Effrenium voratum]
MTGWVDLVDLVVSRKTPAASTASRPEPKAPAQGEAAPKAAAKSVASAPRPEVWTRQKPEDQPDLMRRASKVAQDVGDTAKEYVKTGYDGSSQVAQEAMRMAQVAAWTQQAGENAPWLAGEAMRMASEGFGRFWESAAWAVRRRGWDA